MDNIEKIELKIGKKIEPMILDMIIKNRKNGMLYISMLDLQKNLGLINENFYKIMNNSELINNIVDKVSCDAKAVESYLHEIYDYNKDLIDDVLYDLYEENYIAYTDIYQIEYADRCVNYTNTALSLSLLHDRNMLSNQIYGKLFYELSYDEKMEIIKKVNLKHNILSHRSAFALYSDIDMLKEVMKEKYNKFDYDVYKIQINKLNQERINCYNDCN